jgi:beta-mannosidase
MAIQTLLLDGDDWSMNYYRAKYPRQEKEFDIQNLYMPDGEDAGAALVGFAPVGWQKAAVPGDVHLDLMKAGRMEDPFVARNSDKARWVERYEWWFRKEVEIPAEWNGKQVTLVFDGVDYEAKYFWDGQALGTSADMFIPVRFDFGDQARPGKHLLAVRLSPPPVSSSNHFLNGQVPPRSHHHKMQCCWGWDWARETMSIGIWDHVRLEATGPAKIEDIFCQAEPEGNQGIIRGEVEFESSGTQPVTIQLEIFDPDGKSILKKATGSRFEEKIDHPRLWWPNGYGDQPLYRAKVQVLVDGKVSDTREVEFGIRKVRMLPNPTAPADAYNLTYTINGVKIFAGGGNWAPPDLLPGRITDERYDSLLRLAKQANFNFLRIWGGGLVEKEAFYKCCDRYGIMVWQEFPLSCANYPEDDAFLEAKRIEAEAIVRKVRNHPCIVLWCGGNEMDYYGMSSTHPVFAVFEKVVRKLHPGIDFHISSPDRSRPGEHDHGPWTYYDHKFWNAHFRHFVSEFGCNGPPSLASLKKFIPADELWPEGPSHTHHFVTWNMYGATDQFDSKTLEERIFSGQFAQADSMQYVMGMTRSRQFRTSGCLMWQFNASWPQGAYEVVDYYGEPKMVFYWLSKLCRPRTVALIDEGWDFDPENPSPFAVHVINGLPQVLAGKLTVQIWNPAGKKIAEQSFPLTVPGETSQEIAKMALPPKSPKGIYLVRTVMTDEKNNTSSFDRIFACGTWKEVRGNNESPKVAVKRISATELEVSNPGTQIAFVVELRAEKPWFSDNFFNLLPGEKRLITAQPDPGTLELFVWSRKIC